MNTGQDRTGQDMEEKNSEFKAVHHRPPNFTIIDPHEHVTTEYGDICSVCGAEWRYCSVCGEWGWCDDADDLAGAAVCEECAEVL